MAEIVDFEEQKRKFQRGVSNEEFLKDISDYFKDADSIVVVGLSKNGNVNTFNTQKSGLETLGLIEIAKQQVLEMMRGQVV